MMKETVFCEVTITTTKKTLPRNKFINLTRKVQGLGEEKF